MSLYNVQKQHNLALENVCKNSTHLSKSSSPVEPSSVWKGTEWPIIAQNLKSICFQAFLGAFLPQVQGVPVNPRVQRVQNMYDKGGQGVKNAWLWQLSISSLLQERDWSKAAHNQAFLTPYTLFAVQILNSLDIRFTKTPVPGAKMHPEMPGNKYFSSFGQLWVIQPPTLL